MLHSPHLHTFINDLPIMMVFVDKEFRLLEANQVAHHILGKEAVIGKSLFQLFPSLDESHALFTEAMKQRQVLSLTEQTLTYNYRHHICNISLYPLETEGALIKIEDLSHQMLLDDMVIQSEKMMTIGGLAAGMAHEIKNPLGIILQNIQNILSRLDKSAEKNQIFAEELHVSLEDINLYLEKRHILKFMDNIRIAIDRALQVISTMLNFGTQNPVSMKNENIVDLIHNALSFVEQDYDLIQAGDVAKVKVNKHLAENIPAVFCSSTQITQVFFNLLKNAIQALHGIDAPEVTITADYDDDNVIITFSDNGPGIPEHLIDNLFKPFFTTKTHEQGTGLGLAISHYIISENHHGSLTVSNLPKGGASFMVQIPWTMQQG